MTRRKTNQGNFLSENDLQFCTQCGSWHYIRKASQFGIEKRCIFCSNKIWKKIDPIFRLMSIQFGLGSATSYSLLTIV